MQWSDFEEKHPAEYPKLRHLCDNLHALRLTKSDLVSYVCKYCHEREGSYCFPCGEMRRLYKERFGKLVQEDVFEQGYC